MTIIYFVRHAESDIRVHNDKLRPLTDKGMKDRELVTGYLQDKNVDVVLSSPYRRAVDTVKQFADQQNFHVHLVKDFRERKVGGEWIDDFHAFSKRQWEDFSFKLQDGGSLSEVQERTIGKLNHLLNEHSGKILAVGSHGTALSTIINYYDPTYGFEDFERMKHLMPWIVKFTFEGQVCQQIETIDLFKNEVETRWSIVDE
ncbi:MAG: histidine phosphatase family protein [Sporolactobacillus sp.]